MSEVVPAPAVIPPPSGEYPIDLATALRLADMVNPTINRMRTVILEALAQQLTARTLLVPSLNGGGTYHGHNGDLQRSSGKILDLSEQSLYLGAGAAPWRPRGRSTIPGVNILTPLTDAWFEPLAARPAGDRHPVQRPGDRERHPDGGGRPPPGIDPALHAAGDASPLRIPGVPDRPGDPASTRSPARGGRPTPTGPGPSGDTAARTSSNAEQGVGVATARLAQRLNLDPSVRLQPAGGPLVPLDLVALDTPSEQLIQVALQQRPDLAARTAEIGQAEICVKEEIGRPLLPTLWLGFSGGAFGGGSNLVPPLLGNFGGRTDFDVRLYWTFLELRGSATWP